MLSAAEAYLEQGAEDEVERQRILAKLYEPPQGYRAARRAARPPGTRMSRSDAQALIAQIAAEDARRTGGLTG